MKLTMPSTQNDTRAMVAQGLASLRHAVGDQAGTLGRLAGRPAPASGDGMVDQSAALRAAQVARELRERVQGDARAAADSAVRGAARRGRQLRSLRLTTEPRRSRPAGLPLLALLIGFIAGLTAMYLLQRRAASRRRRVKVRDRLDNWVAAGGEAGEGTQTEVPGAGTEETVELVGVMAIGGSDGSGPADEVQPTAEAEPAAEIEPTTTDTPPSAEVEPAAADA
jgi:hypothetical protein